MAHPLAAGLWLGLWLLFHVLIRSIGPVGTIGVVGALVVLQYLVRRGPGRRPPRRRA